MIKLTSALTGEPIAANPYFIRAVLSIRYMDKQVTKVDMGEDYDLYVKESVEEVLDKIGKTSTFCV